MQQNLVMKSKITDYFKICRCGRKVYYSTIYELKLSLKKKTSCRTCAHTGLNGGRFKGYGGLCGDYLYTIKHGAKTRGLKYEVTPIYLWKLYVKQNRKCALSGIEIFFNRDDRSQRIDVTRTASLDRIDSKIGYKKGNLQWVHKDVNNMKMALNEKDFIKWCNLISKHNNKNDI